MASRRLFILSLLILSLQLTLSSPIDSSLNLTPNSASDQESVTETSDSQDLAPVSVASPSTVAPPILASPSTVASSASETLPSLTERQPTPPLDQETVPSIHSLPLFLNRDIPLAILGQAFRDPDGVRRKIKLLEDVQLNVEQLFNKTTARRKVNILNISIYFLSLLNDSILVDFY